MAQAEAAWAKAKVLLADNDEEWLRQQKEALVSEGFEVITADKPVEAERVLSNESVDAVVYDVRLEDDDDDKDISGLELMEKTSPEVGKVITTKFPVDMATGQTFKSKIGAQQSLLVRYVDKSEGIPAIVAAVKNVAIFSFMSKNSTAAWDALIASQHPQARTRRHARVALVLIMLALGAGVLAVSTENPKWLLGTILIATFAIMFIGISVE